MIMWGLYRDLWWPVNEQDSVLSFLDESGTNPPGWNVWLDWTRNPNQERKEGIDQCLSKSEDGISRKRKQTQTSGPFLARNCTERR